MPHVIRFQRRLPKDERQRKVLLAMDTVADIKGESVKMVEETYSWNVIELSQGPQLFVKLLDTFPVALLRNFFALLPLPFPLEPDRGPLSVSHFIINSIF